MTKVRKDREREEAEERADPMPAPPTMAGMSKDDDLEKTKAELDLTSALAQLQADEGADEDLSKSAERDQKLLALSRELAQLEREKIQRRKQREAAARDQQAQFASQLEAYQRELEAYKARRAEAARRRAAAEQEANKVSDFLGVAQLRGLVNELTAPLRDLPLL